MRTLLTLLTLLIGSPNTESVDTAFITPSVAASGTVIVVVGAAGTPEYAPQFARWADLWKEACKKGNVEFIGIGLDPNENASDRARLQETLAKQARQSAAPLWLVLIGHGTFDGRVARFNLRGPDVSAGDLADWLKPMDRPIAVINTASASGPFSESITPARRPVAMRAMPSAKKNRIKGRPEPKSRSRVEPPPSGSAGICPSAWKTTRRINVMTASMKPRRAQSRAGSAGAAGSGTVPSGAFRVSQSETTIWIAARGMPNRSARFQSASRIAMAAMGSGAGISVPCTAWMIAVP